MKIDLAVLRILEREREIPFEELASILEQAILTAYEKHVSQELGQDVPPASTRVHLDRKSGEVNVFVPEMDDEGEIIGEAQLPADDFGRVAAFAAKQVINQRIRDIGDDKVLGEFRGREGDIVAGVIQQGPNPRMIHVDLGTVEAILPPEEQVPGEDYSHGRRLRVFVTKVERGSKGPQITVSRTHPSLVRKLFALEVPEIASGVVEIWMVFVMAFWLGLVNAVDMPVRQALAADLVPRNILANAIALNAMAFNSARIVGPALAGVSPPAAAASWSSASRSPATWCWSTTRSSAPSTRARWG